MGNKKQMGKGKNEKLIFDFTFTDKNYRKKLVCNDCYKKYATVGIAFRHYKVHINP